MRKFKPQINQACLSDLEEPRKEFIRLKLGKETYFWHHAKALIELGNIYLSIPEIAKMARH